ncbi:MAG: hypothetical protein E5V66_18400 [Mesorhizobium sp.]|uniref:antitoxin Xre/MbcA/ParS-like domain-containing protein n=1 Tax=unclassified Mesorhizobium TaxID=325217 RepID=UPI000FCAE0A6|nr:MULTISPECIES: hypothetical protein [unclassified Mesorhizobium]RUW71238.1 hypothetical protein EOA29_34915 [Mesorhizobium sp. M1E.F.Ca.ET.063.01.1.1]TIW10369.1 MAG: hypothetical protein E5V66_18400 [Mesorhizobium sp.]
MNQSGILDETPDSALSSSVTKEVRRLQERYSETAKECEVAGGVRALRPDHHFNVVAPEFVLRFAAGSASPNADGYPTGLPRTRTSGPSDGMDDRSGAGTGQARLIEEWAGPVAGSTELERRFRIPRSTLHWWQRHNDVIALRSGARKHVFPVVQFLDGRPIPGIRQVLSFIPNPRLAWQWMIRRSPLLSGRIPVEMLREDSIDKVAAAAREFSLSRSRTF